LEAKDMNDIPAIGVASICWYHIVKTANVPFCFFPLIDVEVVAAMSGSPVPFGVELLAVE